MNWIEFNKNYSTRQKANNDWVTRLAQKEKERQKKENEFFHLCSVTFRKVYEDFVRSVVESVEDHNSNFIIDFEDWARNTDGTGYANIWVQSLQPTIHRPGDFKEHYKDLEIKIEAVKLVVQWHKLKINKDPLKRHVIQLEIKGYFNPDDWNGRNELNYASLGKPTFTGFNRIIYKEFEMYDIEFLNKVKDEFASYFYNCMAYYFL